MQNNHPKPTNQSAELNQDNFQSTIDNSDFKDPVVTEDSTTEDSIVDKAAEIAHPNIVQRKKSDTSHITAAKRPLSNQSTRIIKKTKQPQKKMSTAFKIETVFINFFSKIVFFIQKIISSVDIWIEDFVNEYFDTKYYFTYLMCYATFLIAALFVIIFKPF
ncbi:MAG: hypothetical protein RL344_794 [Pseudomonadota bacterium]|jgi:hypothetical protein